MIYQIYVNRVVMVPNSHFSLKANSHNLLSRPRRKDRTSLARVYINTLCLKVCLLLVGGINKAGVGPRGGSAQIVTTLAGNYSIGGGPPNNFGYADGVGEDAIFYSPLGIAMEASGYSAVVVDNYNNIIRRVVISSGLVTTVAGKVGQLGCSNGIGTLATFFSPIGIALDSAGVIAIVADQNNAALRRINMLTSEVTTLAGDCVHSGFADGKGAAARFNNPSDVAMDALGEFALVADATNNALRRVNVSTGVVTTLAGSSTQAAGFTDGVGSFAGFNFPDGVAIDAKGTLAFVVDNKNSAIRCVNISTGLVTTLAGGQSTSNLDGVGTFASFGNPKDVAIDATGSVAIIAASHCIRRINVTTKEVTTLVGSCNVLGHSDGFSTVAQFYKPYSLALDTTGDVAIVADTNNNAIRVVVLKTSPSRSGTPSSPPSSSISPTATPSVSESLTQTSSVTASLSGSATRTPSASPSPLPFTLLLTALNSASALPFNATVTVSDSLLASEMRVWLSRCPSSNDEARALRDASVSCVVTGLSSEASPVYLAFAPQSRAPLSASASPTFADPFVCDAASTTRNSYVLLSASVSLGASFRARSSAATFSCAVTTQDRSYRGGSTLATCAAVPLTILSSVWPLFDDTIIVSHTGAMRSASLGVINATQELLDASVAAGCADTGGPATLAAALLCPSAVLQAAAWVWGNVTLNTSSPSPRPPFSLVLSGASRVVLRGLRGAPALSPGSNATLGGVPCNLTVSDDGAWAVLDTPSAVALCGSASRDCGYAPLTISTAPMASADGAGSASLGVTLTCPPFCPGAVSGVSTDAVPIPTGGGSFALGLNPTLSMGALPTLLPAAPASTSEGIYYAVSCAATGDWTDPLSGACADPSDPLSLLCAYGRGDGCAACPSGALCPGGSRLWPRVGYWAASESSTGVTPCAPPDAAAKCQGWDVRAGAVRCGRQYAQGSFLCGACAAGFFPAGDGSCVTCPVTASAWDRYRVLLELLLGTVAAALLVGGALALLVLTLGGTLWGSSRRLLDLAQWSVAALQTVSQAAPVSAVSLPAAFDAVFRGLAALQVEGVLLASGCTGEYAFQSEAGVLGVALGLTLFVAAVCVAASCLRKDATVTMPLPLISAAVLSLRIVLLLYPVAARDSLTLLDCVSVSLSPADAAGLDGGPPLSPSSNSRAASVPVLVLRSNPLYVCWAPGGSHRPAGTLSAVTCAVVVCALPLLTLLAVWSSRRKGTRGAVLSSVADPGSRTSAASGPADYGAGAETGAGLQLSSGTASASARSFVSLLLSPFRAGYRHSAWYTRHADLCLTFLLSAYQAFLPHPSSAGPIVGKALSICLAALALAAHALLLRPFAPSDAWKGPVRAALLCITALCAAINAWTSAIDAAIAPPNAAAVSALATLLVVAFCVALGLLVVGVGRASVRGLREEQAAIEARLAQAAADRSLTSRGKRRRKGGPGDDSEGAVGHSESEEGDDGVGTFECANPVNPPLPLPSPAITSDPQTADVGADAETPATPRGNQAGTGSRAGARRTSDGEGMRLGGLPRRLSRLLPGWDAGTLAPAAVGFGAVQARRR